MKAGILGNGIQRGYDLKEKRFSLFNTHKWSDPEVRPKCCHVVPVLEKFETFNTDFIDTALDELAQVGSVAAPGYMNPEGIVIMHKASGHLYKKTIKDDGKPKGSSE